MGIVANVATGPKRASEVHGHTLDAVGVRHGAALSSLGRDCLRGWERFLIPFRDEAFDLLEIGAGSGASLRTWREWFPAARLVGLDARRLHLDPPIPGCTIVQGNQADPTTLQRLVQNRRFRIVIDDGSRRAADQILTFQTLFPWLDPGAVYICAGLPEDADEPDEPEQPGAGVWFAELGRMLSTGEGAYGRHEAPSPIAAILRRASGVYLMRGCALVTS